MQVYVEVSELDAFLLEFVDAFVLAMDYVGARCSR